MMNNAGEKGRSIIGSDGGVFFFKFSVVMSVYLLLLTMGCGCGCGSPRGGGVEKGITVWEIA